jgi:diguanylate cyclase (GGDEF)-like protein
MHPPDRSASSTQPAGSATGPELRRGYLLVAIPNTGRAVAWRDVALESGHEVVLVRDGDEAQQEITRRGAPLLLLTDLSLPKVDGFSLVRHLRLQAGRDRSSVIVASAYEPLRAAARELSDSLGIASVLRIDVDLHGLADVLKNALHAVTSPGAEPAASDTPPADSAAPTVSASNAGLAEVMARSSVDAAAAFGVPICLAYLNALDQEWLTAYFAIRELPASSFQPSDTDWQFLRQISASSEPLIIPEVRNHPLFGARVTSHTRLVQGMAGIPLLPSNPRASGTLCLMDTKAIALSASDIDRFETFAESVGRDIERRLQAMLPSVADDPITTDVKVLERLAITDPLTGLVNRRGGERNIVNEISRARRHQSPLSCILIDIDRFKTINDTLGHQTGDRILREMSGLLRRTVRAYDIVIRWGGEEFLLILPGVALTEAQRLAERIRGAVEGLQLGDAGRVTVSGGASTLGNDYSFDAMLTAADRRLYQAKATGRNRII